MREFERWLVSGCVVLLFSLLPQGAAFGVDGVVEINQARAAAGGLTPGDAAKFPVTIERSGSYRLTSNLDLTDANARQNGVAAENTTAILVAADDVTIDLNGFSILGATVCTGRPVTNCAPSGTGKGIDASVHDGITVINGTVRGMGSDGIVLRANGLVDRVRAISNGHDGIDMDFTGRVVSADVSGNGDAGNVGAFAVTGSVADGNGGNGLGGGVVANSYATRNGAIGIVGNLAIGCASLNNLGPQIDVLSGVAGHNACGGSPCP